MGIIKNCEADLSETFHITDNQICAFNKKNSMRLGI